MNVIDIGVIIFILFGAVLGFKRGFTKELVEGLGVIIIVILAYILKNPLSVFFYEHLPFFKIGILKGAEILNIIVYEILAFVIILSILAIILKFVIMASSIFEKILDATIILGIPSKILGAIVGIVHHYVLAFVVLYVLTLTSLNYEIVSNSNFRRTIVDNTPILSSLVNDSINVVSEFKVLKQKYDNKSISENDFNRDAIELFLKYDLIKASSVEKLIESGKITAFKNYKTLLDKYRGE